MMRFYNNQPPILCGVDLHARTMYVCVLDQHGDTVFDKNLPADPDSLPRRHRALPRRTRRRCECMFAWYWLADLCEDESIPFVLGHALSMKAIHGGKTKNDKIDADKIAALLRGGNLPAGLRLPARPCGRPATCSAAAASSSASAPSSSPTSRTRNSQYNLPPFAKKLTYAANRAARRRRPLHRIPRVKRSVQTDLALIDAYDTQIAELELYLHRTRQGRRRATPTTGSAPSPASARSWAWSCSTRSTTSAASPRSATSCPTPGWCAAAHESAGKKKGSPRQEDRQRPPEVGLLRGRVPAGPPLANEAKPG